MLLTTGKPEVPLTELTDYFLLFSWHQFAFGRLIFCKHSSSGRCQVDEFGHNAAKKPGKKEICPVFAENIKKYCVKSFCMFSALLQPYFLSLHLRSVAFPNDSCWAERKQGCFVSYQKNIRHPGVGRWGSDGEPWPSGSTAVVHAEWREETAHTLTTTWGIAFPQPSSPSCMGKLPDVRWRVCLLNLLVLLFLLVFLVSEAEYRINGA